MEVYRVEKEALNQIPNRPIEYEQDLQPHLLKSSGATIGGVKMMYISQEGTPDEEGGFFDILAVDENGDTVVVELKRGKTARLVVSQALEYASGIRKEGFGRLDDRFTAFRRSRGEDTEVGLREAHADFFKHEDEPLTQGEFNNSIHLVVVAEEFDDVTLNMADILREHELDVVCVRYQTLSDPDGALKLLTTEGVRRPLAVEPGRTDDSGMTETEEVQQEFWSQFIEKLDQRTDSDLYTEAAKPRSYLPVRGTLPTDADIALGTDALRGQLQVKLHLRDENTEMYDYLLERNSDLESEIGEELIWDAESARYEQIRLVRDGDITAEPKNWDEFQNWLMQNWKRFDDVFGSRLSRHSGQ